MPAGPYLLETGLQRTVKVEVEWRSDDESFSFSRVLYAYLHPKSQDILYLGKAERSSVRDRLHGVHKDAIFSSIYREEGIRKLDALVGDLLLPEGSRFSGALLSDIESLLILRLQPSYNIQSRQSRISRPGLRVMCTGEWPLRRTRFHDI